MIVTRKGELTALIDSLIRRLKTLDNYISWLIYNIRSRHQLRISAEKKYLTC